MDHNNRKQTHWRRPRTTPHSAPLSTSTHLFVMDASGGCGSGGEAGFGGEAGGRGGGGSSNLYGGGGAATDVRTSTPISDGDVLCGDVAASALPAGARGSENSCGRTAAIVRLDEKWARERAEAAECGEIDAGLLPFYLKCLDEGYYRARTRELQREARKTIMERLNTGDVQATLLIDKGVSYIAEVSCLLCVCHKLNSILTIVYNTVLKLHEQ